MFTLLSAILWLGNIEMRGKRGTGGGDDTVEVVPGPAVTTAAALLGVPEARIAEQEKGGRPVRAVPYFAPSDGVAADIGVKEGSTVSQGSPMFRIADLSSLWVRAEVPEEQAGWIGPGKSVDIAFPALPGLKLAARVDYLYPELDAKTRTPTSRSTPVLRLRRSWFRRKA